MLLRYQSLVSLSRAAAAFGQSGQAKLCFRGVALKSDATLEAAGTGARLTTRSACSTYV